ncbi:hypothetical protein SAMN05216262_10814 [Colwellia chukchiensis]|uniref:Uncharacterized protein n=1 Tax=Colwellia chukchiensis TaxID=641665 RepID=A0A1H7NMS2_9GAMM|nr:hypothetical protein [Colwellia chukchiensis]SEL24237.1 hypothetical protein SAMN05216262_10814 [Colwellia chukchiensis]
MTCITNIILTTAIQDGAWMHSDYGSVDQLNDYLSSKYQGTRLYSVENSAGGHKTISCDIFVAAVDYLNVDEFIEEFLKIAWQKPEQVQLLIKNNHDLRFTSYYPNV